MILNIKESFKGQYTFQKPAWRDECQFLPFRSMYKKKGPLAGGLLLCKSHFTDLFQHGKSSLLYGDIQASLSALAWQKHILKEDGWKNGIVCCWCPWWRVQGWGRLRQGSASSAPWGQGFCKPGRHLPACGRELWDFQLPLLIRMAALASGTWKWDIPAIIETSEVCTYSSGPYIIFFPFSFLFSSLFQSNFGDKNTPCWLWPGSQLTELFTAQHPWCPACAKGVSLCKGFPSE